ncbi:hypothetical protein KEJ47_08760, partial [Candidatus Bathyarchaeota archaeon]|nr:hypothetical protein [Candidatus Bathyarchaeota archaeon]
NRVRYIVRLNEQGATFLWSSTPHNPLESSVDLQIKVHLKELSLLAENLNCHLKNDEIVLSSLDPYNRLLLYACVRPTVKNTEKVRTLATLILDLNSWDAFYWASRFRELWWEHKNYRRLLKVAKAFKLFFGLS